MHEKIKEKDCAITPTVYRSILDFTSSAVCILDSEKTIVDANEKFGLLFNTTLNKVKNLRISDLIEKNNHLYTFITSNIDLDTFRLKHNINSLVVNGKRMLINNHLHKITDSDDKLIYVWVIDDKTEYLQTKEKLENRIKELLTTIKSVGDGLIIAFPNGTIQDINPEAERLTGWQKNTIVNRKLEDVFVLDYGHNNEEAKDILKNILTSKTTFQVPSDTFLISKADKRTPISLKGTVIKNETGIINGVSIVFRDETENKRRQKEIFESEARFSAVFRSGLAGITLSDLNTGYFEDVNSKFLEITGFTRHEIIGHTSKELGLWPNEDNRIHFFDLLKLEGKLKNVEVEFIVKTGERRIVQISSELIYLENRTYVLSIVYDITESIQRELALKTSQSQLTNAIEIAALGPWEYDVKSDTFTFNDHFYRMFHTSFEKIGTYNLSSQQYATMFVHPLDIEMVGKEISNALLTDNLDYFGEIEHRFNYADGGEGILAVRYFIVKDAHGNTIKTYGVNQDITKRKQIEKALEIEKEELKVTLRNIQDGVISTNSDDIIVLINCAVTRITGWEQSDVVGRNIVDFFELLKTDYNSFAGKSKVSTIFGMNSKNEQVTSEALEIESKDCSKKIIYCNTAQIKDSDESLKGYVYVLKDITEQAKIEGQLQLSQKMEAVGHLAAGIAHEINTPMQYIMDNTLFLKQSFDSMANYIKILDKYIDQVKELEIINNKKAEVDLEFLLDEIPAAISQTEVGIERVSKIVRAMKDFSHPGQNEMVMANINQGIEVTSTISKNEWKYFADLELNLDKTLQHVFCNIDEINQVILNMIVNATHAIQDKMKKSGNNDKGKIIIATKSEPGYAVITVTDTGNGIPVDIREKIFDPFFTTKEVGKGTGQGLSIAHNIIVNNHKGQLMVDSTVGVGSTFKVKIPLTQQ